MLKRLVDDALGINTRFATIVPHEPVRNRSPFPVASMTKLFAAQLIASAAIANNGKRARKSLLRQAMLNSA
ncbi:MAG: hypothetical protein HT580_01790 [Dechloromonas sp.]|nr:MAG: hypothetical protein HT580_01790 [Dechloromonas sp.]